MCSPSHSILLFFYVTELLNCCNKIIVTSTLLLNKKPHFILHIVPVAKYGKKAVKPDPAQIHAPDTKF